MADVSEGADPSNINKGDRVLPGTLDNSMSVVVFNHLKDAGYDGAVSIATDMSTFAGVHRDDIVARFSRLLDRLIAGESPAEPVEAPEAEGETEEGAEATNGEANGTAESKEVPATAASK